MGTAFSSCNAARQTIFPSTLASLDDLKGKRVVITGATSGIGLQLLRRMLSLGAYVVGLGRNEEVIDKLKEEATRNAWHLHVLRCDVSDREDVRRTAERIFSLYGGVDVLVNNAGVTSGGKWITDLSEDEIQRTVNVNLTAPFWTLKAFLPFMIEQNSGHIVTVDSVAGMMGVAGLTDYCASKFGAFGMTEALRFELAKRKANIGTSIVCPSYVSNAMGEDAPVKCGAVFPRIDEDYVVEQIVSAIVFKRALVILPRTIALSYLTRLYPVPVYDSIVRMWAHV